MGQTRPNPFVYRQESGKPLSARKPAAWSFSKKAALLAARTGRCGLNQHWWEFRGQFQVHQ